MLNDVNIKRTPKKFPDNDGLDNEFDNLIKQINSNFRTIVNFLNGKADWFSGKGLPQQSLGKDGDFYLDTDTSNIYKKVSGSWV